MEQTNSAHIMEQTNLARIIDRAKFTQTSQLSIRYSELTILPESLCDLTDLIGLDLSDNQLTTLPENLGNLTNLTWLNLENNYLTALPDSLGNLTKLTRLNLYNNYLTALPDSLGNLTKLTRLNLYNNRLTSLPESLNDLTSLNWVSLTDNPLIDLSILQKNSNLKNLIFGIDLPRKHWVKSSNEINTWLLKECNQNMIDVFRNQIRYRIIKEFANFSNTTELKLSKGRLTQIPESLCNFYNLNYLDLSINELTKLPYSIGNFSKLNYLDLSSNRLTKLPYSIGSLSSLNHLNLSNNQLKELPNSIGELSNLQSVNLNNNPLIDLSIFQKNINLTNIYFLNINLRSRYWIKFSDWKAEWLLDENNAEVRRVLIEQLGYDKICKDLSAVKLDSWREYTLLKIDKVEILYDDTFDEYRGSMVLLNMTCPSTAHIHILRVPPEMTSAEEAITWVNHGIHPDRFAVQT